GPRHARKSRDSDGGSITHGQSGASHTLARPHVDGDISEGFGQQPRAVQQGVMAPGSITPGHALTGSITPGQSRVSHTLARPHVGGDISEGFDQ
ncbi:unnamed protein product, partial [Ectocarpus sp. 12 AP-2014]